VSYGADIVQLSSRRSRQLLKHPLWPFKTRLSMESMAMDHWQTTDGGILAAMGSGALGGGWGAELLVIDDPVKGTEQADSPADG